MFIALATLLAVAALLAVAYPILTAAGAARPGESAQETLDELMAQRDAAMQALRELNFDHRVGKISDEDFGMFEASLKHTAADALRALDWWEAQADESLARTLKRGGAATPAARPCPSCGRPAATGDNFCAGCGALLGGTAE